MANTNELTYRAQLSQGQALTQGMELKQLPPNPVLVKETELIEMTLEELQEDVENKLNGDNPALEEDIDTPPESGADYGSPDDYDDETDAAPTLPGPAPFDLGDTDIMERPDYAEQSGRDAATNETLQEYLAEQAYAHNLTDKEKDIMNFLINSLNDQGFLVEKTNAICIELENIEDIQATPAEVNRLIKILQTFEPYGIGARDLRESLIIQLRHKKDNPISKLASAILTDSFDDFAGRHFKQLMARYKIDNDTLQQVYKFVGRLNSYPGNIGTSDTVVTISPLFIVKEDDEGNPYPILPGSIKRLKVSPSYEKVAQREATTNTYLTEAYTYIQAIKKCRETQMQIARIIVREQNEFLRSGDTADIKSLSQQQIAQEIRRDPSVVSRALSRRYIETEFGTFPIARLLKTTTTTADGIEVSADLNRERLRQAVATEDKTNPLTDEQLAEMLQVKRRTIANYRRQLGIPIVSRRKEL